jgi:acyl-CoA reductase-like NAD-dependent aldehyde dehydrogenase
MISGTFGRSYIHVVEGGVDVNQQLLDQSFDKIFFTGSSRVGKIVMEKAAKRLTPVTLELGGKSPAVVHKDADIKTAARRIAWGKFMNAGQTCISPDFVLVHRQEKDELIKYLKKAIKKYKNADDVVWAQEEPRNMGAYSHMLLHFNEARNFRVCSRKFYGSPAAGSPVRFKKRHEKVIASVFDKAVEN